MNISKEASVLINETLKKYNKEVLAFKYIKSLEQMSVSILTKEEAIDFEELDGVLVKFIDEAKNATKNWSIVEENGKLTIQKMLITNMLPTSFLLDLKIKKETI